MGRELLIRVSLFGPPLVAGLAGLVTPLLVRDAKRALLFAALCGTAAAMATGGLAIQAHRFFYPPVQGAGGLGINPPLWIVVGVVVIVGMLPSLAGAVVMLAVRGLINRKGRRPNQH